MPSRKRKYWFAHGKRTVWVVAGSTEFAKEKFQARYGFRPEDPIKSEDVTE